MFIVRFSKVIFYEYNTYLRKIEAECVHNFQNKYGKFSDLIRGKSSKKSTRMQLKKATVNCIDS